MNLVLLNLIPIQKVNEAYERVVNSDVRYRFVINVKSLKSKVRQDSLIHIILTSTCLLFEDAVVIHQIVKFVCIM
jgi:hypothetical protein